MYVHNSSSNLIVVLSIIYLMEECMLTSWTVLHFKYTFTFPNEKKKNLITLFWQNDHTGPSLLSGLRSVSTQIEIEVVPTSSFYVQTIIERVSYWVNKLWLKNLRNSIHFLTINLIVSWLSINFSVILSTKNTADCCILAFYNTSQILKKISFWKFNKHCRHFSIEN